MGRTITITGRKKDGTLYKQSFNRDKVTITLSSKNLQTVDLSSLQEFTELQRLFLNKNQLQTVDLLPLQACKKLKLLSLSHNPLKTVDLSPLRACSKLRRLALMSDQLETINLSPIQACTELDHLDLYYNQLKTIDLSPLQACTVLRKIHLQHNPLENVDVSPLIEKGFFITFNVDITVLLTADERYRGNKMPPALEKMKNKIHWMGETSGFDPNELAARDAGEEEYLFYLDAKKLSEVLLKLEPGIQVQLSRIKELSELTLERVKELIKSLVQKEEIGRYLPMEQVFIRASPEDTLLDKAFEEWEAAEKDKLGKK